MDFIQLILFILPAYAANSAPVLLSGKTPLDFGLKINNERIFGGNKTVKGFVAGTAAGTLVGILLALKPDLFLPALSFGTKSLLGLVLSAGAMAGDLAGSFVKRRLGIKPGAPSMLLDQLPFLLVAVGLALLALPSLAGEIGLAGSAFLLVLTLILHAAFNLLAHSLKLKKVPW